MARGGDSSSIGQHLGNHFGKSSALLSVTSTSPAKKTTKRLSSKLHAAGYTSELSTATKKILQQNQQAPQDSVSKVLSRESQPASQRDLLR